MSLATVCLHGLLSSDAKTKNTCTVSFRGKRIKLEMVLSKMTLHIPEKAVAFLTINGVKAEKYDWVKDGDIVDIFPAVTGG
jgi:hypothetical protein